MAVKRWNGTAWVTQAGAIAATSANTVSTIVQRDGSGNFSAGAITATSVTATSVSGRIDALYDATADYGVRIRAASGDPYERAELKFTNNDASATHLFLTGDVDGVVLDSSSGFIQLNGTTNGSFTGFLTGTATSANSATSATSASTDSAGITLRGARGGTGTTSSGSTLTVTHSLGTTPTAVVATVRNTAYSSSLNTNIFVGTPGATTFTVFANNGAGGAVAATFAWIAIR